MKKVVKIAILLLITISLCACNKKEYGLIDITTEELANNLFDKEEGSYILAFYNEDQNNYAPFKEDLEYIAEANYINIYMMNLKYMSHNEKLYAYMFFEQDVDMNCYLVKDNNEITVFENYTNNYNLRKSLQKLPEEDTFHRIADEAKTKYIKNAEKYLKEGNLVESYNEILKASTIKEGKDFYNKNKDKYNLLNNWVSKTKNSKKRYDYIRFSFTDSIYEKLTTKDSKGQDIDYNNKKTVYYKLLDDIIYICDKKDGEYEGTYQIVNVTEDNLTIKNLKTNKETEYIRRVDLNEE